MQATKEVSFLGIFQDPLLTLVVLILLSMSAFIVPSAEERERQVRQGEKLACQKKVSSLDEQRTAAPRGRDGWWADLREKERLFKEEQQRQAQKVEEDQAREDQERAQLQEEIDRLRHQLAALGHQLDQARNAGQAQELSGLRLRLTQKQEELRALETRLRTLEAMLKEQHPQETTSASATEAIALRRVRLESQLQSLEEEIRRLQKKLDLPTSSSGQKSFQGYREYRPVAKKKELYFLAHQNRLVHIDRRNFEVDLVSQHPPVARLTKKSSIQGEDVATLSQRKGEFHQVLQKHNPGEHYVVILVNPDSFEVFRCARDLAFQKNFEVGWWPHKGTAIHFGRSGGRTVMATRSENGG